MCELDFQIEILMHWWDVVIDSVVAMYGSVNSTNVFCNWDILVNFHNHFLCESPQTTWTCFYSYDYFIWLILSNLLGVENSLIVLA